MARAFTSSWILFVLFVLPGCDPKTDPTKQPAVAVNNIVAQGPKTEPAPTNPSNKVDPGTSKPIGSNDPASPDPQPLPPLPETTAQTPDEKYDAALAAAYRHLSEKNEELALASLQEAQAAKETEFIKGEIDRVKAIIERNNAADKTAQDIHTVLSSGRAEEAAKLAADALQQFGDSDAAAELAKLKRQADALLSTQLEDKTRKQRFLDEAEAARKVNNLRGAVLAYEQAVANGADVTGVKDQFEELRVKLTQYDQSRARAAELRRDPYQLEEAVVSLKAALQSWDTLQVRQEIRECEIAVTNRRDRLAVADFETIADVGIPRAGEAIAEDILPHFKARFDLVERGQVNNLLKELQLEGADLHVNERSRAELGKLAKARYMVLGSVSSLHGITVNARLVDVQSGLIVQTGKIVAGNGEELSAKLPTLARILMMSDEQKIKYERELAEAARIAPAVILQDLPALPEAPAANVPMPAPIIIQNPRPPEFGPVALADFDRFGPANAAPGAPVVIVQAAQPVRDRAVFVAVELGDNLFRRGRFVEAQRQFEFALAIAPGRRDIALRIDRVRPFVPQGPVFGQQFGVVFGPVFKPRMAVLPFVELGRPGFVRPGLGVWTAQHIGPYFSPAVDVVDQGELFWWMARLGLTYRDVLIDPTARLVLARALNARHFLMGALQETFSFNAKTYLVDTEFNVLIGAAQIHCHNAFELKCRLGELARLTSMTPAERAAALAQAQQYEALTLQARTAFGRNDFALAITVSQKALVIRPDSVEVRLIYDQCLARQRQFDLFEAQRLASERDLARRREAQRRQLELAAAAEQARRAAELRTAQLAAAEQQRLRQEQIQASSALVQQARIQFKAGQYAAALTSYDSALALNRSEALVREIAQTRAFIAQQEQQNAAAAQLAREAEQKRLREAELQQTRAQIALETQKRIDADKVRIGRENTRNDAEYQRLLDLAQQAQAKGNVDGQVSALQAARRLKPSAEVDRMVNAALIEQARAAAEKQGAAAKAQLETQLAAERERRIAAEAEAKRNQEKYQNALRLAKAAMAQKKFDEAANQFRLASLTVRTDEAVAGLKQAEDELAKAQVAAKADAEAKTRAQRQDERFQKLLTDGRAALAARQLDQAVQFFQQASRMKPGDVDAQTELAKAQQAVADARNDLRRKQELEQNQAGFRKLVDAAQTNIRAKQYDAAIVALTDALKLKPNDPQATAALRDAQAAQTALMRDTAAQQEAKKKREIYEQHMQRGRTAMSLKNWDAAIEAFQSAQKVLPGDVVSAAAEKDAAKFKSDAESSRVAKMKDQERSTQVAKLIQQGRAALSAKRFDDAIAAAGQALKLAPESTDAKALERDATQAKGTAAADMQAEQKRRLAYNEAMRIGQTALTAKRYPDAINAFTEALKQVPNDGDATKLLNQARTLQTAAAADMDRQKAYDTFMLRGRTSFAAKRFADAADAFKEALRIAPNDPAATKALNEVQIAMLPPKVDPKPKDPFPKVDPKPKDPLPKVDPKPKEDPVKTAYIANMAAGRRAMDLKQFDAALRSFTEALRLVPNDPEATKAVAEARAAMTPKIDPKPKDPLPKVDPKPKDPLPKVDPKPKVDPNQQRYTQAMQAAATLEGQSKYADALQAYQAALQIAPNDAVAKRRAEFCRAMIAGQRDLAAGKFAEAIIDFDQALKLDPNNADAKKGLAQAKAGPPKKK